MDTPRNIDVTSTRSEDSLFSPKKENRLKKAFYNAIAISLFCICSFFAWGSFIILEPFLKPLFWALLCGSVLHPLKYRLSSNFKTWIIWIENADGLPIVIELISCPIKLFLDVSDNVGGTIFKYWMKIACGLSFLIIGGLLYSYTPQVIICLSWKITSFLLFVIVLASDVFQNSTLVVTILLAFVLSVTFYWDKQFEKQFLAASYLIWFGLSAYASGFLPYIKLPIFVVFQLLFVYGFLLSNREGLSSNGNQEVNDKKTDLGDGDKGDFPSPLGLEPSNSDTSLTKDVQVQESGRANMKGALSLLSSFVGHNTSDWYISWVSISCLLTLVLSSGWLPYCLALLLIVYIIRLACNMFGFSNFVYTKYEAFKSWLLSWYDVRKNVLIPAPVTVIYSVFKELRVRLLCLLKESSDSAATVMVILALVFFVIFGSIFLVFQAYTEGVYMMKVGGSVINQTVVHNPELTKLLPDGWEQKLDSVLNNTYTYGRQGLSKLVRNMLSGVSEERTEELENRALEVWDRVYQAWMMNAIEEKTIGPKVTSSAVYQTWDHFLDAMHKTPELASMSTLTQLAQNNMAMLTSGLESVWELVKGNASIVFSAFFTVLTVVFSHSFAVLNFCINMIIFLTALFYLLSSSRTLYKPVEVITNISPVYGSRLAFAMENAIKEVLTASFKLAVFYGMWTWLIHTLFQMNIVYIPSVLAAMLAVIPALGTYWACLPAVLDLWLVQGKSIHALSLAVCQFLPTLFVDATIYTEINEGHPYVTGLSVAGGLFCMGAEGAILGPLTLCGLYVVISMSTTLMQDATTPVPSASHAQRTPRSEH